MDLISYYEFCNQEFYLAYQANHKLLNTRTAVLLKSFIEEVLNKIWQNEKLFDMLANQSFNFWFEKYGYIFNSEKNKHLNKFKYSQNYDVYQTELVEILMDTFLNFFFHKLRLSIPLYFYLSRLESYARYLHDRTESSLEAATLAWNQKNNNSNDPLLALEADIKQQEHQALDKKCSEVAHLVAVKKSESLKPDIINIVQQQEQITGKTIVEIQDRERLVNDFVDLTRSDKLKSADQHFSDELNLDQNILSSSAIREVSSIYNQNLNGTDCDKTPPHSAESTLTSKPNSIWKAIAIGFGTGFIHGAATAGTAMFLSCCFAPTFIGHIVTTVLTGGSYLLAIPAAFLLGGLIGGIVQGIRSGIKNCEKNKNSLMNALNNKNHDTAAALLQVYRNKHTSDVSFLNAANLAVGLEDNIELNNGGYNIFTETEKKNDFSEINLQGSNLYGINFKDTVLVKTIMDGTKNKTICASFFSKVSIENIKAQLNLLFIQIKDHPQEKKLREAARTDLLQKIQNLSHSEQVQILDISLKHSVFISHRHIHKKIASLFAPKLIQTKSQIELLIAKRPLEVATGRISAIL